MVWTQNLNILQVGHMRTNKNCPFYKKDNPKDNPITLKQEEKEGFEYAEWDPPVTKPPIKLIIKRADIQPDCSRGTFYFFTLLFTFINSAF